MFLGGLIMERVIFGAVLIGLLVVLTALINMILIVTALESRQYNRNKPRRVNKKGGKHAVQ